MPGGEATQGRGEAGAAGIQNILLKSVIILDIGLYFHTSSCVSLPVTSQFSAGFPCTIQTELLFKPRQLFLSEVLVCPGSNKAAVKWLLPRLYAPKPSQITQTYRRCRQRTPKCLGYDSESGFRGLFSRTWMYPDTSVGCFNLHHVDEAANPN